MNEVSLQQVAKLLDISPAGVRRLEKQGLIHPLNRRHGVSIYSLDEINHIKDNHGLTIAEEAAQVNARMQQKVVSAFSLVQKIISGIVLTLVGGISLLLVAVIVIAVLFKMYPTQTADFFGFYYRYNVTYPQPVFVPATESDVSPKVLGVSTTSYTAREIAAKPTGTSPVPAVVPVASPVVESVAVVPPPTPIQTSFLAKLLKPVASISLLLVKTTDAQQYQQTIKIPAGIPGANGNQGPPGISGKDGQGGPVGPRGAAGTAGDAGQTGTTGATGPAGSDASGQIGLVAGSGLSGGGNVSLGSSGTLAINAPACAQDERLSWNGINFSCRAVVGGTVVSPNEFYAGPVAGAADLASFRALDAADLGSGTADADTVLLGNQSWFTLLSGGKIDSNLLPDSVTSGLKFQGLWNANSNSPSISSGASNVGNFYIVSTAGSTSIDGQSTWNVGDWIVNNGVSWERVPSTSAISSVNGQSGAVVLTSDEISQGVVNKYFSNTLARNALGGAGPIAYSAATGNIDCPTCVVNTGNGALSASGGISLSGSTTNRLIGAGDVALALNDTTVSPGTYGSVSSIPQFTVDTTGRLTAATGLAVSGVTLAGDVSGTVGGSTVSKINGATLGTTTATAGNILVGNGSSWVTRAVSGDGTLSSSGALTLKNTGTAGSYGAAATVPVLTTDAQGRVTGVTNTAIAGLTASNLSAGDFSSKINSGSYSINVTGSAGSFTGSLLGDVTGTQGSSTVSKINGVVLGTTTATSGNVLIGNGTSWGTQSITGDATLANNGALTLKNVGTSGTYGSAVSIPVVTTDAQGRVTGVTNTTIAGLTASNLTAGDFSSKINSGSYSINVTGSAGSFTGALTGDVSGTQGSTTVAKINGSALGTTTPSSGNVLIANGTSWVTHALSGDATLANTGSLTLKSTGTAGTYGADSTIPVITTDAQGRVTGVTNTTIAGLTASNLTAGDFSSKINTGSYSIAVTGSAGSFTGSLAGDVSGTQGGTTVGKINGAVLGTTTATSGNLLVANGTSWATQALSGDATLASGGVLTLKNTGTAGTFGTALAIPVLTTDAQGRVTGVTNTTIAGLTASHLSAGDFSSKINSGSYSINVTGSAGSFTGSLLGDITGTQGSTTVAKINGAVLGTTTATAGNLLIGSGTTWVTRGLSGDATVDSTGVVALNYTSGQAATTSQKGFLTAADWNTFNNKQTALGYTAESVANKSTDTSLGTSNSLFPTQNAVKTYVDNISTGLNWQSPVELINVIADVSSPVGSPVNNDGYIINTGGATGAWSAFAAGDLVQWQIDHWVKIKSLGVGDRFGVAFVSSTTPSGSMSSKKNYKGQVSGGSAGAFTYSFSVPSNNDALFVSNVNDYYRNTSFTYSSSLAQWVQFSASDSLAFGNGLTKSSGTVSLGVLTSDWNQTGVFNIATAGNVGVNGGDLTTTGSTATLFNANATTLSIGGDATTINLGAAGATVTGAGALTVNSGLATDLTLDSGSTGNVKVGTGASAKSIAVGSSTSGTTLALTGGATWSINAAGNLTTTGTIVTSGSGTITSAGLLTAANGLTLTTGALNLTSTSGALSLSGLGASSLNTGANNLLITSGHLNVTATGINNTAIGLTTPSTGAFTTLSASGQVTSTVATGTAPFVISSTTNVANLNASSLNGLTFSAPGAIGGGTAAAGTFTTLIGTTSITDSGLTTAGVTTNTSSGVLGTLAGTTSTVLHGNAAGLPTFAAVSGSDLAATISISTTGNVITTGSGTVTSAGLLTAANGLTLTTGALNLTSTSGSLNLSGLGVSSISTGLNDFIITSNHFNTTATGINNSAIGATTPSTGAFTSLAASGQFTSTVTTGTAPFIVSSTTNVANLNASSLDGLTFSAPGAIGSGTAAAGTFTTLSGTTSITDGGLTTAGVTTNTSSGVLGTLAGTTSTVLHGNAAGLPTFAAVSGSDLAANITVSTTGNITTTGTGTINAAGLLTAGNGFTVTTGAVSLTGTSGALSLSGLGTSSITTSAGSALSFSTGTTGALTLDSGTTGNVNLGTGTNAKTIAIGNATSTTAVNVTSGTGGIALLTTGAGNLSLASGTTGTVTLDSGTSGNVNIGTNANAKTIAIGNATSTTAVNVTSGTGGIALLTTGAGTLSLTSGTTGVVTLDSGTTGNVNVGTGASAKTIEIGNATTTTAVNVISGTGGISLLTTGAGALSLDSGTTGNVSIGTNANAKTIALGNATGTTAVNVTSGTGGISLLTTGAGTLSLDSGTTGNVNIGTNANAKTVAIGNATGVSAVNLTSGTGGIALLTSTTGALSLTTGTTGAITLDSGTTGDINIGTNANAKTVDIGNATGATGVNLTSGTGGIALLTSTTGALSLTTGTTGAITLDSGTTGNINIGTNANAKTIALGNATGATAVNVTSGTGGISLLTTGTGALSLDSGTTGNVSLGTNANAKTLTIGNGTGATIVNVNAGTGGISLLTGTSGNLSLTTGTTGAITLDSGTTGNISIGTNANAKTIALGNATGATGLTLTSGTNGITVLTTTTGALSLKSGTTGAVTLDSGTTGTVGVGNGAFAKAVTIGNTTGATSLTLSSGTDGVFLNGAAAVAAGNLTLCIRNATKKIYVGSSATSCNTSSSRYKHDIESIDAVLGLDAVNKLRPVAYTYNETGEHALGFIAEDAATIDPRLVVFDAQGRPDALKNEAFIPMLALSIQQLDQKIALLASSSAQISLPEGTLSSRLTEVVQDMFRHAVDFFSTVAFHGDVQFFGRPTFNNDSAGFAVITKGQTEVLVQFEQPYSVLPVVVASADVPCLYAVTNPTQTGFSIRLSEPATQDTHFSWTAIAVREARTSTSTSSNAVPSPSLPTPEPSPSPSVLPVPSPVEQINTAEATSAADMHSN